MHEQTIRKGTFFKLGSGGGGGGCFQVSFVPMCEQTIRKGTFFKLGSGGWGALAGQF